MILGDGLVQVWSHLERRIISLDHHSDYPNVGRHLEDGQAELFLVGFDHSRERLGAPGLPQDGEVAAVGAVVLHAQAHDLEPAAALATVHVQPAGAAVTSLKLPALLRGGLLAAVCEGALSLMEERSE